MPIYTPGKVTLKKDSVAAGLLDAYGGAAAAYSLRGLSANYTGPVVRVRRSSDSTEQDFTAAQVTNGTLTTFCGAGNGFVRTWYDQSGNGNHTSQTTTTKQPQIVSSGALNLLNTKPALKFDGSDDFLSGGDVLDLGSNSLTGFAFSELGANGTIYAKSLASSEAGRYSVLAESSVTISLLDVIVSATNATVATVYAKGLFSQQIINGSTNKLFVNAVERASVSISSYSALNTSRRFLLGAYNNATDTGELLFLNGSISEVVLYLSNQTSNRTAIESNINAHYAIY